MTVNAVGLCTATTTANTLGATNSNVTPSGVCTSNSGTPDDDIWYSFVAPASGGITLQGTYVSGSTDVVYQIFSSACSSAMTSVACIAADGGGNVTGLTPSSTYYVRFYTTSASVNATYTLCLREASPTGSNDCSAPTKLCTDGSILTYNTNPTGNTPAGNNYGCLGTTPRPNWFYFQIENAGNLYLTLKGYDNTNALVDADFAVWGPYGSLSAAQSACGTLPTPDTCSYDSQATERIDLTGVTAGQFYLLLVTGYSTLSDHFTLQQTGGAATTSCSGVTGACDISNVTVGNIAACNNNSTSTTLTDDYYTADVTVTFTNKPTSGTLQLSGAGIHSGTYATAVSGIGTTSYIFTGVKIKADGSIQTITAQFSAQTGCNYIKTGIPAVTQCSCTLGAINLTVTSP